jgi:ribonuclease J
MLHRHLETARAAGVPEAGLLLATDGDVLAFPDGHIQRQGRVPVGRIFRSRDGGSDIDAVALRERTALQHGLVVAAVALERGTGRIVSGPQLYGRGVTEEEALTLERAQPQVQADFEEATRGLRGDDAFVRETLIAAVRRAFKAAGHRRPAVLPAVLKL